MDEQTRKMAFEPFFTTKEIGKGTGLGLSMVYGVVKQNHGWTELLSEPGQGTTILVHLPREAAPAEALRPEAPDGTGGRGEEVVLVVDDEPAILAMAASLLSHLGYTVLAAGSPSEALQLAEAHPGGIDLLLIDLILPAMNGRDLALAMRTRQPQARRLFMSGNAAGWGDRPDQDDGAPFLQKPFTLRALGEKVREALDG